MDSRPMLLDRFGNKGYFVEAGAHDGIGDSQTYLLERNGWTGICVEPSSAFNGLLRSRRTCHKDNRCLWSHNGWIKEFMEVSGNAIELSGILTTFQDGDGWDRVGRPHTIKKVETVTLNQILSEYNAPRSPEVLFLDTEGSELEILKAHDFSMYRFKVIVVEHNNIASRKADLASLLKANGYGILPDDGGVELVAVLT